MKNHNDMPQAILAESFGLIYKSLYFVEYKDPFYPCRCQCHSHNAMFPESPMLHCIPCCSDRSYKKILRYSGVFKDPKRGNYFLFTDPDPVHFEYPTHPPRDLDLEGMDVQHLHILERSVFFSQLHEHTITLHRRAWDKLPKNRHEPVDLPVDFSGVKND